jgi:signal transduction histidine kinase/CheY-like chemotaxis protein
VEVLRDRWATALHRRERYEARCRLRRSQDGAWRWHSVRAVPILDPTGEPIRWLGAFVDDHELRMLVEQNQALLASEQRARQTAEDAGRMKDEFLATLSHELRTPLNAIVGWTSLLKRGLSQDETVRAVEVIERNAQMQRRLIDELLDVSRIISGHVRLDLKPVVLDDVVAQAIETVRPVAEAKGLVLETTIEPVRQPITGDPSRLQQVFANLLDNAVKFTPAGGRVSLRLDRIGDEVRIRLSDSGIGIPPGFLPYVFDRFRQAESPGARRFGGLGLGLAIVRQIVHMHGGRVEAASAGEGLGAQFTVTLGLGSESLEVPSVRSLAGARTSDGSSSPLRGLSMLIIEDDPDSREMLSVLLENAGAVPVAAATVTEALRLLGDLEIDVVLSDIGMPERDGFDLIRALRSFPNPRVRNAPALAVTAFARAEDRRRILAAGFDAHVTKPVEPLELFRAVADVSRGRAADRVSAPEMPPPL